MAKFNIGDEVVAVGECMETRKRFGVNQRMEGLIAEQEMMRVTMVNGEWLVSASFCNWAPCDLELYNASLINE